MKMDFRRTSMVLLYLCLIIPTTSIAFDDVRLRILPSSKAKIQHLIAANFPFHPSIQIEIVDNQTQRIKTGNYSSLNITVTPSNTSACISHDASFQLKSGFGVFIGSICSPISNLSLSFTATNQNGSIISSDWTPAITVTDEIYISVFENDAEKEPYVMHSIMMGAVADVNDGTSKYFDDGPILPGRTLKMHRYFHGGSHDQAVKVYRKMSNDFKIYPGSRTPAVLGFSNDIVSELLLPISTIDQLSVLSYANDSLDKFTNKEIYPYFNRLIYSDSMKYQALVVYLKSRKWNDIVLLQSSDSELGDGFANFCKQNGIQIHHKVSFPIVANYDEESAGRFRDHFAKIKRIGVKIILTFAKKPTSFYLFTEALRENVTSQFGYQWIGFDNEDDFPHYNQPKRCHNLENLCNFAFKGMTFITSHYQINGYSSSQWTKLWKRYFEIDIENEKNDAIKMWKTASKYGMVYDAVHLYAMAFRKLIDLNQTITGPVLSSTIRQMQSTNFMMKNISFTSTGNPSTYFGRLSLVWPNEDSWNFFHGGKVKAGWIEPWDWSLAAVFSNPTNGYLIVDATNASNSIEVKSDGGSFMLHTIDVMKDEMLKTGYIRTDVKQRNLRRYRSIRGLFFLDEQKQVEEKWNFIGRTKRREIEYEEIEREEVVPLSFNCEFGCGGNRTNEEDVNLYENGYCAAPNTCICYGNENGTKLWSGETCEVPECPHGCMNGNCSRPNTCICDEGWNGLDCNQAICTTPVCYARGGVCEAPELCVCRSNYYGMGCSKKCSCINGKCRNGQFGAGTCVSCDNGYFGTNCKMSIYAVVFPSILGLILLVVIIKSCLRCYVRRSKLKAELLSDDWIVTWSQLKRSDMKAERSMFLTKESLVERKEPNRKKTINTGTWQGFDVHYQKFNRASMQASDSLRQEIKVIRDLQHENLIKFLGACLQFPNVSVLTELASKGSLTDILNNDDVNLPWIFKYSLLKDICRGLEQIHQSEIGSHGRLKSSNCLVDSRWTLKLSGFGLNSFREESKDVPKFQLGKLIPFDENDESSEEEFYDLFWTPPEILKTGVYHLDHVGYGTKEGDVYSFAIIFSEICARECPFENLSLTNREIVDLIAGRTTPQINRIWNTYLASRNTEAGCPPRPCIMQMHWPKDDKESRHLKMLIERCWTTDPSLRPIPKDVLKNLEKIDPNSGGSIEKLVAMLEKYSNNLEDIVAERAKALTREKQKTENIISRLLPRPVVEDLKLGKSVDAEKFDCISILFSDFVDFYSVAELSTPSQIIELLNDIYGCFDKIVIDHDAHKIETIGNSYMVVSGLPATNNNKHANIMARIALHLRECVSSFIIYHLPQTRLQLRIGIHSGSVVGGIVGLSIPRYCVFGDSVQIASAMEATCKPMKIQISQDTKDLIEHLHYDIEMQGELDLKELGHLKTWWLEGEKIEHWEQACDERTK